MDDIFNNLNINQFATRSNGVVEECALGATTFLDKSTNVYGGSGKGKSTIVKDILYNVNPFVNDIVVVNPTDKLNKDYSGNNNVPAPLVHDGLTDELIDNIFEKQEKRRIIYDISNKTDVLESLFVEVCPPNARMFARTIDEKLEEHEHEILVGDADEIMARSKINNLRVEYKELKNKVFKFYINRNIDALTRRKLSDEQQVAIKWLNINPRMVLVFDDVTPYLKRYAQHPKFKALYYQCRHYNITSITVAHNDSALARDGLRENAYNNIFADSESANNYIKHEEKSLGDYKNYMKKCVSEIFTDKYTKMLYERDARKVWKFRAKTRSNIRMGAPELWEFLEKIKLSPRDEIKRILDM